MNTRFQVITYSRWFALVILIIVAVAGGSGMSYLQRNNVAHADTGYLHRQDMHIVDGQGNPVQLRGFDLGNWFLWENWLMGSPTQTAAGETQMKANLATIVGQTSVQQFQSDVYANTVTQADFQRIASLGFNVVRVPFNYHMLEDDSAPGVYKDSGWQQLDNVVSWAQQAGIYVVLDMHAAPGAQNPYFIADPANGKAQLWTNTSYQTRTINMWKAIAARYSTSPNVAAYDLLNEPVPSSGSALTSFYQQVTSAIRSVDTNHMVMVEGANYSADTSMFTNRFDDNMLLSYHQYLWGTLTPEQDLTKVETTTKNLDIPLWIGEFGLDSYQDIANRVYRFSTDPLISGYALWTWRSTNFAGVRSYQKVPNAFTPTAAWLKTITWMANTSKPKPTAAEAQQGMTDYINLLKTTTLDNQLISAMQAPTIGSGTGLIGTYYGDSTFTTAKLTRIDPTINFNWGYGAPASNMPINNFTVRWTGSIQPQYSETYQFTTTADDKVRVWINNTLVVDDWVSNGVHTKTGSIALQANQKYSIKVEYAEVTMGAQIKLQWQSPSTPQAIVPASQLYSN